MHCRPYSRKSITALSFGKSFTHIDINLLPVRIFNCWIVALDPDILNELCCIKSEKPEKEKDVYASPVRQLLPTPPRMQRLISRCSYPYLVPHENSQVKSRTSA